MTEPKKEYKNRCPMPFGAIHYSMAGTVGICPFITTNKDTITIEEYRKEPVLVELKKQLLRDERPDLCHECYYLEDQGLGSERMDKVNHFEEDVYELDELHNVNVTGATNGQVLTYSASTGLWVPTTISTLPSAISFFTIFLFFGVNPPDTIATLIPNGSNILLKEL